MYKINISQKNKLRLSHSIFFLVCFLALFCGLVPQSNASETDFENMMVVDPDPGSDQNQKIEDQLQQMDHEQYEKNKSLEKSCRPRFGLPGYDNDIVKHMNDFDWRLHHPASVHRYKKDCSTLIHAAKAAGCDYGERLCLPSDSDD